MDSFSQFKRKAGTTVLKSDNKAVKKRMMTVEDDSGETEVQFEMTKNPTVDTGFLPDK